MCGHTTIEQAQKYLKCKPDVIYLEENLNQTQAQGIKQAIAPITGVYLIDYISQSQTAKNYK